MSGRRLELHAAVAAIQEYERGLAERLLIGLKGIACLRISGLTAKKDLPRCVPTVMVTATGHTHTASTRRGAVRARYLLPGMATTARWR